MNPYRLPHWIPSPAARPPVPPLSHVGLATWRVRAPFGGTSLRRFPIRPYCTHLSPAGQEKFHRFSPSLFSSPRPKGSLVNTFPILTCYNKYLPAPSFFIPLCPNKDRGEEPKRGEGPSRTLNKGFTLLWVAGGLLSSLPAFLQLPAIPLRNPSHRSLAGRLPPIQRA